MDTYPATEYIRNPFLSKAPVLNEHQIKEQVHKIVRCVATLARQVQNDFMVQQLAHYAIDPLIGPNAIHDNSSLKTAELKEWADELLDEALRSARLDG